MGKYLTYYSLLNSKPSNSIPLLLTFYSKSRSAYGKVVIPILGAPKVIIFFTRGEIGLHCLYITQAMTPPNDIPTK